MRQGDWIVAGVVAGGVVSLVAASKISKSIEQRKLIEAYNRRDAQTGAMVNRIIEDYYRTYGHYPKDLAEYDRRRWEGR